MDSNIVNAIDNAIELYKDCAWKVLSKAFTTGRYPANLSGDDKAHLQRARNLYGSRLKTEYLKTK